MVTTSVQDSAQRVRSLELTRKLFGPADLPTGIAATGVLSFARERNSDKIGS